MKLQRVFCLIIVFVSLLSVVQAQDNAPVRDATGNPQLDPQLDQIEQQVETLRGLRPTISVDRFYIQPANLQSYVSAERSADYNLEKATVEGLFNYVFNFTPDAAPLAQPSALTAVFDFYEPERDALYVVNDSPTLLPLRGALYAFWYTQALLDQAVEPENWQAANPDQALALEAVSNGDAEYTLQLYIDALLTNDPAQAMNLLRSVIAAPAPPLVADFLPYQAAANRFTHESGMTFINALAAQGGLQAVDQLYENPPLSTEQILHLEKYEANERPDNVEITPLDDATYQQVMARPLGEFGLMQHLQTQLDDSTTALVASGWGGDRFELYQQEDTTAFVLIWRLSWDSTLDAAEFNDSYHRFLDLRLSVSATLLESEFYCWDATLKVCLVSGDNQSLIVYAADLDTAQTIIALQPELE